MSELDHPCKNTCSGWKQGYEKGREIMESEKDEMFNDAIGIILFLRMKIKETFGEEDFGYKMCDTWLKKYTEAKPIGDSVASKKR